MACSYRLPAVELHALRESRLRFGPSLHLLHDPLDVIPGDPVEKHGSRSWTQLATAWLCLATHNFHILSLQRCAPLPSAARTGAHKHKTSPDSGHPPRHSARQLEETAQGTNYNMDGTSFPKKVSSSRKKKEEKRKSSSPNASGTGWGWRERGGGLSAHCSPLIMAESYFL